MVEENVENQEDIYNFLYSNVNFADNIAYGFNNYAINKDRKSLYNAVKEELAKIGLKKEIVDKIAIFYVLRSFDNSIKDDFYKMIDLLNTIPNNLVNWATTIETELYTNTLEIRFKKVFEKLTITLRVIYSKENTNTNNNKENYTIHYAQLILTDHDKLDNTYITLYENNQKIDRKNSNMVLRLAYIVDRLIPY